MSLSAGKVKHMNALSNSAGVIAAAAMDQRGSLQKGIAGAKGIPQDQVTAHDMEEFKIAVSKMLTPHASAILLDPEFGLPAARRAPKTPACCWPMNRAATTTRSPAACPTCCPIVSVKRIVDWGADAVKILLYYTPFRRRRRQRHQARLYRAHRRRVRDLRHSVLPRIRGLRSEGWRRKGLRIRQAQTGDRNQERCRNSPSRNTSWTCSRWKCPSTRNTWRDRACTRARRPTRARKHWIISAKRRQWPRSRSST